MFLLHVNHLVQIMSNLYYCPFKEQNKHSQSDKWGSTKFFNWTDQFLGMGDWFKGIWGKRSWLFFSFLHIYSCFIYSSFPLKIFYQSASNLFLLSSASNSGYYMWNFKGVFKLGRWMGWRHATQNKLPWYSDNFELKALKQWVQERHSDSPFFPESRS